MSIKSFGIGAVAVSLATMFFTNPTEDQYADYITKQFINASSEVLTENICEGNPICKLPTIISEKPTSWVIRPAIKLVTTHNDYQLFSIYRTEIPGMKITTIGIFNNFIPISGKVGISKEFGFAIFE